MNRDSDDKVGTHSNLDEIIATGAATYALIKMQDQQHLDDNRQRYGHWVEIAKAVAAVSHNALTLAGTNNRMNPQYATTFSKLLDEHGFAGMESTLRANLLRLMENFSEIEAYRATLTEKQRLRWNNPVYLLRKWDASKNPKPKRSNKSNDDKINAQRVEIERLQRENAKLRKEVKDLMDTALTGLFRGKPRHANGVDHAKLANILGRLGSDQEGEVLAGARAAEAMLKKNGVTWHDVLGAC
jgi:hypothetical protein